LFSDTYDMDAKYFSQSTLKVYEKPCRYAVVYEKL